MIKPDGVHRALVGRIIERFEARGYKLVGIKVWPCSSRFASEQHHAFSSRAVSHVFCHAGSYPYCGRY